MNHLEHQYWNTKQNEADYSQETAKVNLLKSLGFSIFLDGDQWCAMLGENIQEASHCFFGKTPIIAVGNAINFIYNGSQK